MALTRLRIPLLEHETSETPVFTAANLLRAARIRKGLPRIAVPPGCLLDFDGELLQHLSDTGKAVEDPAWPCFHTRLFRWRAGCRMRRDRRHDWGFICRPVAETVRLGPRLCISRRGSWPNGLPPFFLLIDKACATRGRALPAFGGTLMPIHRWCYCSGVRTGYRPGTYRPVMDHGCSPGDGEPIACAAGRIVCRNGSCRASTLGKVLNRSVVCLPTQPIRWQPGRRIREGRSQGLADSFPCAAVLEAAGNMES
jgi:hypothetical protein